MAGIHEKENMQMDKVFTRDYLKPRLGKMEQLASIRRYTLDDGKGRGMRAFEVSNGSGLAFTVYPDRGLDIGPATFNGLPLAWMTPNGAVAPAFYNPDGFEWLRTWCAGLLTTCGLLNAGGPCETAEGPQGQHGRADHIPAEEVNAKGEWLADGRYRLEITGVIGHTKVFGEKLVSRRTIRTYLGSPTIEIADSTENAGFETMPLMQLYHMNFGWPLVDESAVIVAPGHETIPQNDYCREHLADWDKFMAPTPGFREQVFYHDIPADAEGMCNVSLENGNSGLKLGLSFRKAELPFLVQWKMPGQGEYVCGLEPANCYPEGQCAIAKRGILRHIEPGQIVETVIRVKVSQ